MALPLLYQSRATGAIALHSVDQSAFSKEDMIFMQTMADQLANGIENARLYKQAQLEIEQRQQAQQRLLDREHYLAVQLKIQNLLLATKSSELPYDEVLELLGEASQASRVYLFRNDYSNGGELLTTLVAEWRTGSIQPRINEAALINLPLQQALPRWAELLSHGSAISSRTMDLPNTEQEFLAKYQVKAMLALPVMVSGEFFGLIGFDNCVDDIGWEETAQDLLSSVVAAVSLWLERQRAEEELVQALQQTEALVRIGNTMATATSEQVVFEKVLLEYLQLLNLTPGQASILLFEHHKGYTQVATQLVNGEAVTSNLSFPANQDKIAAYLRETEAPLVIDDVLKNKLTKDSRKFWQQTPQVRALLFLPLVVRHRVIGAVSVGVTTADYAFTSSNLELGQIVTDQLAIWLENRQLLAETQYRSDRLQIAAEVSRAASSILGMDDLINTSVNLIRDRFEFYYVGLFLLDGAGEWAVLRAGTGKAGHIQLARHHRLKVGGESMIGWSIANRQARIALDVGQDAVHFKNPILPDTHSEMALPLISRDEVIGALTVQSVEREAFSDEDITLLQTMADQLANAITNARLFERVAEARRQAEVRLHETQVLQLLSQKLATTLNVDEVLKIFFDTCVQELGFDYIQLSLVDQTRRRVRAVGGVGLSENQIENASQFLDSQDIMADIVRTGKTEIITAWDDRFDRRQFEQEGHVNWIRLFTPVTLRHENVGLVEAGYKQSDKIEISENQVELLKAFISQTALAIENAKRYETSRQVARREALIKEITTKVRASTQLDTILRTTVREIGEAIGSKRAYIQLKAPHETSDPARSEESRDDEK
jgi:GAF domain-containing protein